MDDKYDLTQGSIMGKLLRFFFPILFGMLFQQLYNTVDAIVVGRCVGPEALAAVGGSPAVLTNLVIGFFSGLGAGATVIISQYCGAREDEQLSRAVHTIIAFCVICGVFLTVAGWFTASWSLRLVKTPEDILASSAEYLRLFYLGSTSLLLFNIGSGILRSVGDSRWPLFFLGLCCVLNIGLDLLFVAVFAWGVAGVAWATVLSLSVSALLILLHLSRAKGPWRFHWNRLRIHPGSLRRILTLGIPSAIQGSMYSLSNIIIQAAVNRFGTTVVAAWTATGKFDGIFWVTTNAIGAALCTFVGQCYGAGKLDRLRSGVKQWLIFALCVSVAISAFILGFGRWAMRLFADDPQVLDYAVEMLWYFAPFYFVWIFIEIFSNALRGAGDSLTPMIICLLGVCLLRVFWIWLVVPHWNTVRGVSVSYPVTWAVTALVFAVYYRRGRWLRHGAALHAGA